MDNITNLDMDKLLADKRVVAEIQRHLWIESEKVGRNIGFEQAKEDWLKNFSAAWLKYHLPEDLRKTITSESKPEAKEAVKKPKPKKNAGIKRRRAKSYL